jgi:plastocyanin
MDNLVQQILDLLNPIIIPEWGGLVALIPIIVLVIVVAWFAWVMRRFATAGPTRRAPARVPPVAPPTIHMPGPSTAPILAAFGAAALFFGLVVGGLALPAGAIALTVTLLLWGREAIRDYDRIDRRAAGAALPAVIHEGPPPGVHMPGPSIRPLLGALGSATLLGGLVVGGPILLLAVLFLSWTLVGWLVDFTAEYRKVVEADRTGHLENVPPRRWPGQAIQVFVVLFVVVAVAQSGIINSIGASAAGPGASGSPGASGPALPPGTLSLVAKDIKYQTKTFEVEAGKPFSIVFKNEDPAGVAHDVDIRAADGTSVIQDQPHTEGGQTSTYQYTSLEAGTYTFICSVHPVPDMTGTLTVK